MTNGQERLLRLSDLLGLPLHGAGGTPAGHLADVLARVEGQDPPAITALIVRRHDKTLLLPLSGAGRIDPAPGGLVLDTVPAMDAFVRRPGEVLLEHDLLDAMVIDLRAPRVVRANDVLLEGSGSAWRVAGVDIGPGALLHRLLPRLLRHQRLPALLSWVDMEMLASEMPDGLLPADHRRLSRLHPADIARVADAVPARQAAEIVASLEDDLAADTMEEMVDERQADVVERLDPERAADIVEHMAPDAAADVLAELEPQEVDDVLRRMDPAEAAEAHALLTYPKHTAGGLMTTAYVVAPPDLRAGDAAAYLRPQLEDPDWVYYVYVVADARERRLLGVFTLRDLLIAAPDTRMEEIMQRQVRQVRPDTPASKVAKIMSDYNLLALPVTDDTGRLLGIVSVDDALEVILPASLRRRLPRIFS